mmetsp:Transcript_23873/g.50314  ORF Transcript_23873/g.50314 Transcript_23873/m.50314 type:complete len:85 (-) Transcript_23873:713-967(-)
MLIYLRPLCLFVCLSLLLSPLYYILHCCTIVPLLNYIHPNSGSFFQSLYHRFSVSFHPNSNRNGNSNSNSNSNDHDATVQDESL